MNKQLGIGVRVFVGWTPEDEAETPEVNQVGLGIITDGPYPPGEYLTDEGDTIEMDESAWDVDMETGTEINCIEGLLTPIDDDGAPHNTTEEAAITAIAQA